MKSQEYPSVILVLTVLLGMQDKYFDVAKTRQVQYALVCLYVTRFVLKRSYIVRDKIPQVATVIER